MILSTDSYDDAFKLWMALSFSDGVGAVFFQRLLEAFGSPDKVYGAGEEELKAQFPRLGGRELAGILKGPALNEVERQLELCSRYRASILTLKSSEYPAPLKELAYPPPVLYAKGRWLPEDTQSLSMVGTRQPTSYGQGITHELGLALAGRQWTVVSGLAMGIDAIAHAAAIQAQGRTIGVIGTGIDIVYPRENRRLFEKIGAEGALFSEYPFGTQPLPGHFPRRNRIISGLSLGTLVVEAGMGSGALITARFALEQGKEIFAIPGDIYNPKTEGTHHLIQQGAHLVRGYQDIVNVLEGMCQAVPSRRRAPAPLRSIDAKANQSAGRTNATAWPQARPTHSRPTVQHISQPPAGGAFSSLDEKEKSIFALLRFEPVHLDSLGEWAGSPAHKLVPILLNLELKGLAQRLPGSLFIRA